MKYQEIITGLRTLRPSDFDYNNMAARCWERGMVGAMIQLYFAEFEEGEPEAARYVIDFS